MCSSDLELVTPVAKYLEMLNSLEDGVASLRGYYREVSYGRLDIVSHLLPAQEGPTVVSYQDMYPRSYYQPWMFKANPNGYRDQGSQMMREQQMVRRALEATIQDLPAGTNLDGDEDGFVDNLTVIVSGKPDGWSDLLWPHMSLQIADLIYLDELIVLTYNFQLNDYVLDKAGVGVLAHEMFHTLGAPDLYHYSDDNRTPAGPWDLMEWDRNIPQHMTLHLKVRYGRWADRPPLITDSGTYTVNPLTSPTGQGWLLPVPGQPQQTILVEYRRKAGTYESSLPESGLLFWRVDERWWGNDDGPPDELYVFRKGGTKDADGDVRQAQFSADVERTRFSPATDPAPFDQAGNPIGLHVTDISATGGDTMSFTVCMAYSTCFLKQCGDDGCGGTCGTCDDGQLCEDRLCVTQQKCGTLHACLEGCGEDEACAQACRIVPAACPAPATCRSEGACDEATGECSYPLAEAGTPCDDRDKCTIDDACRADGTCGGNPNPACAAPEVPPEAAAEPAPEPMPEAASADEAADPAGPDDPVAEETADCDASIDPEATPTDALPEAATDLPPVTPNRASGGCTAGAGAAPAILIPALLAAFALAARRRRP